MTEDRAIDYLFRVLDIPWWYYAVAVLIGAVIGHIWRWEGGLLTGYMFLLLAETVLIRRASPGSHFQQELFWSWRAWRVQKNQILTNIVMFIPVGILTGKIWRLKGMWFVVGLSIFIEALQLVSRRGLCEFDDVIHNCIGALVGIGIVVLMKVATKRTEDNR